MSDIETDQVRIETETREKFSGSYYQADKVMMVEDVAALDYFSRTLGMKLALVRQYGAGRVGLDLCCATGQHVWQLHETLQRGVGVDFSMPLLQKAVDSRSADDGSNNVTFSCGNARELPFGDGSFGIVYSFSSLYYVSRLEDCLREIHRGLEPGGVAVFELGNLYSLNTLVCRAHGETSAPCHQSVAQMRELIDAAGLEIVEHHSSQILPMWGSRPFWLRPLLLPFWNKILGFVVGGRMLDHWICAMPGLRRLAFRQLFVCRRGV